MVKALILIVVCDLHSRKGDSEGGVRKGDYKVINMVEINSVMGKVIRETVIQDNGNDLIYLYTHFGGNKDIMNYLKIYGIGNNFMRAG